MLINKSDKLWAEEFFGKCEKKLYSILNDVKTDYPMFIEHGQRRYDENKPYEFNWTSGFWGGMMWLLYLNTNKKEYLDRAVKCSERFREAMGSTNGFRCLDNHDLGFVFGLTNVAHYKLTGDAEARIRALHAAAMLAGRFNPNGDYIIAWSTNAAMGEDTRGFAIIDCLLNLPLLYWASEETNDPHYAAIAKRHAYMAQREFFKPDGSVYHIVDFDPETGKVRDYPVGQGYASGSAWSRGQSWAVYGFMMSYIHTGDEIFKNAAKRVADYVIANMKDNKLAPVDYMQPELPKKYDASANAITACGMLELAKSCTGEEREKYYEFAIRLLKGLYEDVDFGDKNQALVQSATEMYHRPACHVALIYADFFLLDALSKLIGRTDFFMW